LVRATLRKYPELVRVLQKRHEHYNETLQYIDQQVQNGKVLLLQPDSPLPLGRICHDPEKLQLAYEIGRAKANGQLDAIKNFLAQ
ncbi:MAG: patatin family protein, partial [Lentisphaeria bacterium]|nr:patatin family protein [Lentisphaeria bacterium]